MPVTKPPSADCNILEMTNQVDMEDTGPVGASNDISVFHQQVIKDQEQIGYEKLNGAYSEVYKDPNEETNGIEKYQLHIQKETEANTTAVVYIQNRKGTDTGEKINATADCNTGLPRYYVIYSVFFL